MDARKCHGNGGTGMPPTHRRAAALTAVLRLQPPNNNKLSFSSAAGNSAPATNDGKNEAACGLWTPASPPVRRNCRLGDQQRLTWPLAPRALFLPLTESLRPPTPRQSARPNEGEQLYQTVSDRFTTSMAGSDSRHGGSEGRLRQLENMRGEGSMPAEAQKQPKRSPDQTSLAAATGNRRTPPRGRTVDRVPKAGPLTEGKARWARRGATTG